METQKKVVEGESCFVCARIVPKKEKVYMFGETSIDFCAIISFALNDALMWGITLLRAVSYLSAERSVTKGSPNSSVLWTT